MVKATLGFILVSALFGYVYLRYVQAGYLRNSTKAEAENYKHISLMATEISRNFDMECPQVYIMNSSMLNAFVIGSSHPYSIVITSMAAQQLRNREISFLIAHEMGHIDAGHVLRLSVISPFGYSIPILTHVFYLWRIRIEYTADRAGLLSTGDLPAAILALIKITKGDFSISMEVSVKKFLNNPEGITARQIEAIVGNLHPHIIHRINNLLDYANSKQYKEIRSIITQESKVTRLPLICPHCGTRNKRIFKVCTKCGRELPQF